MLFSLDKEKPVRIKRIKRAMKVGERAPLYSLLSDSRSAYILADELGNGPVLMLFFPAAFTGTCTSELNEVSNDIESYAPASVVGISTDTPFALAEYSRQNGFRMPLLSDHDATVSSQYDTKYEDGSFLKMDRISKRSAFVVDKQGIIQYAEVLDHAGDVPDLMAIKSLISTL